MEDDNVVLTFGNLKYDNFIDTRKIKRLFQESGPFFK